jgi:hypothetical protein
MMILKFCENFMRTELLSPSVHGDERQFSNLQQHFIFIQNAAVGLKIEFTFN